MEFGCPMKLRKEEVAFVPMSVNAAVQIVRSAIQNGRYALAYVDAVEVIERHRFVEIAHEAGLWAELLRRLGLEPGSRVIVLAGCDRHWRSALLGVLHAGGVALPCPASTSPADLRFLAVEGRAVGVVSASPRPELVELLGMPVLWPGDLDPSQRRVTPRAHDTTPDDFGLILYRPDGAGFRGEAHTHESLLDQASATARLLRIRRGDSFWSTVPDGTAESIWHTLAAWHVGAEVVVVEAELAPYSKLELLHRLRGGAVWFTADEYSALAAAHVPRWVDLTHVRHALTDGEPTEGAIAFQQAFGVQAVPASVADETADAAADGAPVADVVRLPVLRTLRHVEPRTGESEREPIQQRVAREAAERERRRAEQEARRREEQRAKERQKEEERRRKEEANKRELAQKAARAEEQRRAEEAKRLEEERLRAEREDRRRAEQQAKERQHEEERRRKEAKQRELAEKAARAEEQRRAEEAKRLEDERRRAERDARRREEQLAKEAIRQRELAQKAARAEQRRADEEKHLEEERLRAEQESRLREEQQAEERRQDAEQRLKEQARQRELAEQAARAVRQRRAEEVKRHAEAEQRRRREEANSRQRAEREAEQGLPPAEDAERAEPNGAVAEERTPTKDANRRLRRVRREASRAQLEHLPPDVISRLGQYSITTAGLDQNGDTTADATHEPERAPTPDEHSDTQL